MAKIEPKKKAGNKKVTKGDPKTKPGKPTKPTKPKPKKPPKPPQKMTDG